MSLLNGHLVLTLGTMAERPLARYLATLGATVAPFDPARLDEASFLIDDLGLEATRPQGDYPRLIHVSVTPYGSFGPYAGWKGGELQASAMGGTLRLTGQPDRAPVKEAGNACTFHADMVAASGAMAAHFARTVHGHGQHVDVSVAEVAFSRNINGVLVWHFDRRKLHRVGGALNYGRATVRCIWPLADGWCFHSLMTGRFGAPANQALSDWIDEAGLENPLKGVDWLSYNRSTLPAETRAVWETAIAAFFATRTKAQMSEEGRRRGINACVVNAPGDVLADPHLQARNFWTGAAVREPSRFATVTDGPETPSASTRTSQRPGPLAGVRVLDFSWALVGSLTTKTLGDLGAEVIKVESRTRPCLTRLDVQVSASQPGNFDDKPWFAHLNTSKRSLALDMKKPESREVLDPLIEWADVVVENFSPGTMAKLGLDYEKLAKRNPNLIMVSGSVFGQTGPLAAEWGVDGTGAALSGRTFLTGWPDRDPVIPGAVPYGDVIVPYVMAAMASAALARRHETGQGCHIDASMYEICVQQMRDEILAAQTGAPPQRQGNDEAGVFWQSVLPARGEDRWIAISAMTQAERDRLQALAGGPLEAWTAQHDALELAQRLQAEGIAAAPVQDIEDLMDYDPQVAARQSLVDIEHAHLGVFGHVRTPLILSRDAFAPFRAPDIGEHNRDVALELSGLTPARFAELEALGVFR
ncbi:coA-transferase family III family protein [Asticcacaulis biprosthecium C19]|uniref:CoA-transferase family III family protein n=1 Tax=Asticcacaulis biprosthecium C19 TaxID=715226 RepID=F4QTJ0_9CAUL|nr:CoA transferase [Asticcacaulis biprosthecium]EGF90060.1 coA-transferase family III family protein [Asticcacaulis biprosthecium C19]